jgi:hypothetical protein
MTTPKLIQWLRDNSSGVYRPAAEAADLIERLQSERDSAVAAINDCVSWANGREDEWGNRAETSFNFLHNFLANDKDRARRADDDTSIYQELNDANERMGKKLAQTFDERDRLADSLCSVFNLIDEDPQSAKDLAETTLQSLPPNAEYTPPPTQDHE